MVREFLTKASRFLRNIRGSVPSTPGLFEPVGDNWFDAHEKPVAVLWGVPAGKQQSVARCLPE